MRKIISVIIAFVALSFAVGCSSIDCSLNSLVMANYEFRSPYGADTLRDTLTVTTRTAHGDTVLLNMATDISVFSLPVSYTLDADTLIFNFRTRDKREFDDIVIIKKTNISHFESVDCPPTFFHDIEELHHDGMAIDSLVVTDKHIDNGTEKKNIHIYLRSDM